jgi:hypothetical protein
LEALFPVFVFVPEAFVPCQYQVVPLGGVPVTVNVCGPHEPGTMGIGGTSGYAFTCIEIVLEPVLQQPVAVLIDLK